MFKSITFEVVADAKATGLTVDAIRFYEPRGLLPHPQRSRGGFRLYSEKDVCTLQFIRRVQGLGFSLRETRELVSLCVERIRPSPAIRNRLAGKLEQVRAKIIELRRLERELIRAQQNCAKKRGAPTSAGQLGEGASPQYTK